MKKQHKGHATSAGDSSQDFEVGYPAETTEAFCDGHVRAFAFFGGVPQSILYDNTRIAVARILGDGKRQRTRVFAELQSHYLFEDRFGRPDKGNDKGKVEGLVGYARRNFLVPIPVFESFEALNAYLLECCRRRQAERLRGREGTIGERLERDLAAFQTPLPPPYDACEKVATTVSSLSLVRYRLDDVAAGVRDAIDRGVIGFDAVKHLVLCRIERRPPRLDMSVYPYLPHASVALTSARTYMDLLSGVTS